MSDLVAALSTTGGVATAGIRIVAAGAQEAFQAHASVCKHELAYLMDVDKHLAGAGPRA